MKRWYVVSKRPHEIRRAELNQTRQGFRSWLPVMERMRRHVRRIDTVQCPVFPGYLSLGLDVDRKVWSAINGTFGVRRQLTDGRRPRSLPDTFVQALRASIGVEGTCSITPANLNHNTSVRMTSVPFVDCVAVVQALAPGDRVKLLLKVLGGSIKAEVPRQSVAATASARRSFEESGRLKRRTSSHLV